MCYEKNIRVFIGFNYQDIAKYLKSLFQIHENKNKYLKW